MFDETVSTRTKTMARDYIRLLIAKAAGDGLPTLDYFNARWPNAPHAGLVAKAAVEGGRVDGTTWGAELAPLQTLASAYVEIIRNRAVIGRLTGYREMPFATRFPIQTGSTGFSFVPEGGPVPAGAMSFVEGTFKPLKAGGIVITTQELARLSSPKAEDIIARDLGDGLAGFLDSAFLDPSNAGVAGESPASVLYGAPSLNASGDTPTAAAQDLRDVLALVTSELTAPFWIMRRTTATHLAATDIDGGPFKDLGPNGGSIFGIPVLTTGNMAQTGDSPPRNRIALLDAAELLLGDGGLEVRTAREGDVMMNTAPDSPMTASTVLVNLWQHNLLAFMGIRYVNWSMRRAGGAAYLDSVTY